MHAITNILSHKHKTDTHRKETKNYENLKEKLTGQCGGMSLLPSAPPRGGALCSCCAGCSLSFSYDS